jgi:hypothetical protein
MTKTIQVAADRAHDGAKTVLPAEVARGVYMRNAPSLAALKLMHLLIATAGGRMAEPVRHEIRLSDIRKIDGMKNHDRASLTPIFGELAAAVLTHDDPEKMVVVIGGLLDVARIDYRHEVSNDLLVTWYFGGAFREMAEKSCHWAILDRQTVFALSSKYSILLFQYVASLMNLDHVASKTFTVTELRAVMGVPENTLSQFGHFNSRAIQPAIAEINQTSRMVLTATAHKIGRTVASVTIAWEEKPQEGKQEAKRELDRPKVGRAARREGKTEMLVPPFPASGGLDPKLPIDAHWRAIFEANVRRIQGGKLPDSRMVCDAFRKARGDRLDDTTTEKHFVNFCRAWRE